MRLLLPLFSLAILTLAALPACQEVAEPVPTLTQDQWQRIQTHVLEEAPEIQHPVNAIFAGQIELLGYDLSPGERVEVGTDVTITWYWRVIQPPGERVEIFVHLDSPSPHRQGLDHEAIDGLYTTVFWEEGQIIRDVQTVTVDEAHANQPVRMYLGLWRKWGDQQRVDISDAGSGQVEDNRLLVGGFEVYREVPEYDAKRTEEPPIIDGNLNEFQWSQAGQTRRWVHPNTGDAVRRLRSQARVLWDDEAMYVGLSATDRDIWATMTERDSDLWEEEVLELYLDPVGDGRNYVEIQINPLGTIFDATFPSTDQRSGEHLAAARALNIEGMEAAVSVSGTVDNRDDTDRRWSAEFRIPWASLPDIGTPTAGTVVPANFYRYDRSAEGDVTTAAWAPVFGGSFHQPDKFGHIRLTDEVAASRRPGDRDEGEQGRVAPGEENSRGREGIPALQRRQLRARQPVLPSTVQPTAREIEIAPRTEGQE